MQLFADIIEVTYKLLTDIFVTCMNFEDIIAHLHVSMYILNIYIHTYLHIQYIHVSNLLLL